MTITILQGLSLGPKVKPDMAVLYAIHDVVDSPALRVLILHNQELQFSGVFVISHWQPRGAAAAADAALWSGSIKNTDVSIGSLARPFACSLAPLTGSLAPHYSLIPAFLGQ